MTRVLDSIFVAAMLAAFVAVGWLFYQYPGLFIGP